MSYDADILAEGNLASFWKGGDAGSTAADSKGTNTGTYTGSPSLAAGLVTDGAQCHDYNGSSQYVAITGSSSLQPVSCTCEAWVNLDTFGAGRRIVTLANDCFALMIDGSGHLQAFYWNGSLNRTITSTGVLTAGTTFHVAGTFDDPSHAFIAYINGVQDGTNNFADSIGWDATTTSAIGSSSGGLTGSDLDGRIGKVAVYNSALSAASLLAHYRSGIASGGMTRTFNPIPFM